MTSNVNPNYPIPGLDQSSKGFRDNFAIIKKEIEGLQGTTIQLVGDVLSNPIEFGSSESLVIATTINGGVISLPPPNFAIQYNNSGTLTGSNSLVFDPANIRVGINTSTPGSTLDVAGDFKVFDRILMQSSTPSQELRLELLHQNNSLLVLNNDIESSIGNANYAPLSFFTNLLPRVTISSDGFVGIGTTAPITPLDVISPYVNIAHFIGQDSLADNLVRLSTTGNSSTIGLGLENVEGDTVGGIRIDINGTVSIHSGESLGAQLSTSSARVNVDKFGKVGIGEPNPNYNLEVNGTFKSKGITDTSDNVLKRVGVNNDTPNYEVDVIGDIATSGAVVSTVPYYSVDTTPTVIDTIPADMYRSAKYFIQVVNGTSPFESVDIIDFIVTHANGTAYSNVTSIYSTSSSLGILSVQYVSGVVEVIYTGNAAGNTVRLSKNYIIN